MRTRLAVLIALGAPVALGAQVSVSLNGQETTEIRHLPSGDSIAVYGIGTGRANDGPPIPVLRYHPYFALEDTNRVRRDALELWELYRARLDSDGDTAIVLQAVSTPPDSLKLPRVGHVFGLVLTKQPDGSWRELHRPALRPGDLAAAALRSARSMQIVRLRSGDSVLVVTAGPVTIEGISGSGGGISFHPFVPFSDSARVVQLTHELWNELSPGLDRAGMRYVVLAARSNLPNPKIPMDLSALLLIFLQKRDDGAWYAFGESEPFD